MAEHFLYLTTTGRTSGEARQIEIWFVEHGGRHYLVSEMRAQAGWVKNLTKSPAVTFCVGTRDEPGAAVPPTPARARVVSADDEPALAQTVAALMDRKYSWSEGLIVELSPT